VTIHETRHNVRSIKIAFPALIVILCLWSALSVRSARAGQVGDTSRGLAYAREVCAQCHLVEDNGPYSANPDAPSFRDIANTPGMNGRAIAVWLQTSHPTMPDLIVPPDDTDDLIAYITSLRTQ